MGRPVKGSRDSRLRGRERLGSTRTWRNEGCRNLADFRWVSPNPGHKLENEGLLCLGGTPVEYMAIVFEKDMPHKDNSRKVLSVETGV